MLNKKIISGREGRKGGRELRGLPSAPSRAADLFGFLQIQSYNRIAVIILSDLCYNAGNRTPEDGKRI